MKRLIVLFAMVVWGASLCWAQGGLFDAAIHEQEEKANEEQSCLAALWSEMEGWPDCLWRVEVAKYKDGRPCVSMPGTGKAEMVFHIWFDVNAYQAKINRIIPLLEKIGERKVFCGRYDMDDDMDDVVTVWEVIHEGPVPQEYSDWMVDIWHNSGEEKGAMAWQFTFPHELFEKVVSSLTSKKTTSLRSKMTTCYGKCYPVCVDKEGKILWHGPGKEVGQYLRWNFQNLVELFPGYRKAEDVPYMSTDSCVFATSNEYYVSYVFEIPQEILRLTADVRCVLLYEEGGPVLDRVAAHDWHVETGAKNPFSEVGETIPPLDKLCQGEPAVEDVAELKEIVRTERKTAQGGKRKAAKRGERDISGKQRPAEPICAPEVRTHQPDRVPSMAEQRARFEQQSGVQRGERDIYGQERPAAPVFPSGARVLPPATQENVVSVEATGHGATPRDAGRDAMRNAVEQVVGSLVDTQTKTENKDVIADSILTSSQAYIKNLEILEKPHMVNGVCETKIRASVKKSMVAEKLEAVNISTTEVSGQSLFAEALTRRGQAEDAAAILEEDLSDLRTKFVSAELAKDVNGKPAIGIRDDGSVYVVIRVFVDNAAYKSWLERVIPKPEKIATKKKQDMVNNFQLAPGGNGSEWPLVIQTAQSYDGSQVQVAAFDFNDMLREKLGFEHLNPFSRNGGGLLSSQTTNALLCDVQLLNASGSFVSSVRFMISRGAILSLTDGEVRGHAIAPYLAVRRHYYSLLSGEDFTGHYNDRLCASSQEWFFGLSLGKMPEEVLEQVQKVECRVLTGPGQREANCGFFVPDSKTYIRNGASSTERQQNAPQRGSQNNEGYNHAGGEINAPQYQQPGCSQGTENSPGYGSGMLDDIGAATDAVSDGISGAIGGVKKLFW